MKRENVCLILLIFSIFLLTSCSIKKNESDLHLMDVPTPSACNAVISGVILEKDTGLPTSGVPFLAQSLTNEESDLPTTISFSFQNNQSATYDTETGEFYFEDVPVGSNYVIILFFGPGDVQVVTIADTQNPLIISVTSSTTIDMGIIEVEN